MLNKCSNCGHPVDKVRNPDFEYDSRTHEYTCGPCLETIGDDQRQDMHDQMQWEMYHSPDMNWSGNR